MTSPKITFTKFASPKRGVLCVLTTDQLKFGAATKKAIGKTLPSLKNIVKAEGF